MQKKKTVHDEVRKSLTAPERIALKRLTLIIVRGKRGRGVPILLPPHLKESMDLLDEHNAGKLYMFSRESDSASTPIRAYQVMAQLASVATPKLKHPENVRCTKLQKHLATLSQLLDLKDNELEQLANHMGHDVTVHREYYRLPMETLLLAKMSKLLNLAQEGKTSQFKGKTLEEVSLSKDESLPPTYEESDSEDDSDHEDDAMEGELDCIDQEMEDDNSRHSRGRGQPKKKPRLKPRASISKSLNPQNLRKYCKWTKKQEQFILGQKEVRTLLRSKRVPGKTLCLVLLKRGGALVEGKSWTELRNKIHNMNLKDKAKLTRLELDVQ